MARVERQIPKHRQLTAAQKKAMQAIALRPLGELNVESARYFHIGMPTLRGLVLRGFVRWMKGKQVWILTARGKEVHDNGFDIS